MAKVGRNEPCPCGSGKKYKNCHWGKEEQLSPLQVDPDALGETPGESTPFIQRMIPALVAALVLGVAGLAWRGGEGLVLGASIGLLLGIGWMLFKNPPPPRDADGGSSINFGN